MWLTTGGRVGSGYYLGARSLFTAIVAVVGVIVVLLLIFYLDQSSGSAPVQHLYYLPIILGGVTFGLPGGIAVPMAAIVLYHLANPRLLTFEYGHWDFVQVVLFIAVGVITAKLMDDRRRFHLLATTDDLTGLHNLRSFEDRLAAMVCISREAKTSLALLVLDVDHLKSLNDQYGHLAGAEAVRTVGHIIAAVVPREAVACRYGGDEFVVAAPRCTSLEAQRLADDLRHAVFATTPFLAGVLFPATTLSVSVGVAYRSFDSGAVSGNDLQLGEDLFRSADEALYQAKARGRNHVCVA